MTNEHHNDRWAAGTAYEAFMGRWSRALARPFLASLDLPRRSRWLEIGCGTGALTEAILETQDPTTIVACEPTEPLIEHARRGLESPLVAFRAIGCGDLPRDEPSFDVAVSSLVLNFLPDPLAGVREMSALVRQGGTVAAAVWDYADGMEFLRRFWDAASRLNPTAQLMDEGVRFPLCEPARLVALFRGAGLEDVQSGDVTVATEFDSFEDYWGPFLGGTGPAPTYVSALSSERRRELETQLRTSLQSTPQGRLHLRARAWSIRGRVPS